MNLFPFSNIYKSVFKAWTFLKKYRKDQAESLHWLPQEPILCGTQFLNSPQTATEEDAFPTILLAPDLNDREENTRVEVLV